MEDRGPLLSISELARLARLPVRTIRFWSDAGVLPPAARTGAAGGCMTRRAWPGWSWSSRCASWGLARRVLGGQMSIAEVAAVHLDALDAQIRGLRLHRAVLAVAVKRAVGKEDSAYELPRSSGSRTRR